MIWVWVAVGGAFVLGGTAGVLVMALLTASRLGGGEAGLPACQPCSGDADELGIGA